jgi:hypothetical protein
MTQLHNAQDAIRQAIEGGGYENKAKYSHRVILQDRLFWQALGKARGWGEADVLHSTETYRYTDGGHRLEIHKEFWKIQALRYLETCLSGGDEKKFWEDLQ